MHAGLLIYTRA